MKKTKLALCSVAALLVAGQAFAHTGVRDQALERKLEGTTVISDGASYNAFTLTHGCGGDSGKGYPALGQSALFPFGDNAVWRDAAGAVMQVGGDGNGTIVPATGIGLNLAVAGIAGAQSSFPTTHEIVDDLGRVHGLLFKDGAMQPQLYTLTPFRVTAPQIANNCVKRLMVRMGVITHCDINKNEASDAAGPYRKPKDAFRRAIPLLVDGDLYGDTIQKNVNDPGVGVFTDEPGGNGDNNRSDWWFTAPYPSSALYVDPQVLQPTYWTTMTVNNSKADIDACVAGGGTPVDVSVEPGGADFDAYMNANNLKPFAQAGGPL